MCTLVMQQNTITLYCSPVQWIGEINTSFTRRVGNLGGINLFEQLFSHVGVLDAKQHADRMTGMRRLLRVDRWIRDADERDIVLPFTADWSLRYQHDVQQDSTW